MAGNMTQQQADRELPDMKNLSVNNENDNASSANSAKSSGGSTPATEQSQQAVMESNGPIRTPFPHPLPTCHPERRPDPSPDQLAKYHTVLTAVQGWKSIPKSTTKGAETEPLAEREQMWLTRECLFRYLRATSWNTTNAIQRLQDTLVWRREFGVDKFTADYISEEIETGKETIQGYDVNARPCLFLDPGKQNTKKSPKQIEALVYMLERTVDLMPPGQETCALLINFKGATSGGSPSVGQGKQTLTILQGHYPERLGRACISDLPWYINTFFKLISPFIDPVTRSKMIFNTPLRDKHVPSKQLWKDYGGDADFQYDHKIYWPAMNKLAAERREVYTQRWEAGGKRIGEYEAYLRGGEQAPLKEVEDDQAPK